MTFFFLFPNSGTNNLYASSTKDWLWSFRLARQHAKVCDSFVINLTKNILGDIVSNL